MIYRQQVCLDRGTYEFYSRIALSAGLSIEQVLSDALFRLAGELAMEAIGEDGRTEVMENM